MSEVVLHYEPGEQAEKLISFLRSLDFVNVVEARPGNLMSETEEGLQHVAEVEQGHRSPKNLRGLLDED